MTTIPTLAGRLRALQDELYDIAECAEDLEWRGVQHKTQDALGALASALTAAEQYEAGRQ